MEYKIYQPSNSFTVRLSKCLLNVEYFSKTALDAYVLLEVYEYLKARLTQLKIKFDIHKCIGKRHKMTSSQQDKDKDKKNSQIQEQQQLNEINKFEDETFTLNASPIRVQDLKIVCDNMLGGLGKELRRCGVDTVR